MNAYIAKTAHDYKHLINIHKSNISINETVGEWMNM